jgi:hypothetical protein
MSAKKKELLLSIEIQEDKILDAVVSNRDNSNSTFVSHLEAWNNSLKETSVKNLDTHGRFG